MFALRLTLCRFCLLRFCLVSIAAALLTACGGADQPADVAQAFYKAAAAGDAKTLARYVYTDNVSARDMAGVQSKVGMVAGEISRQTKANDGLKKITVVESALQADQDTLVKVQLAFGNGKQSTESLRLRRSGDAWQVVLGSAVLRRDIMGQRQESKAF